AANNKLRAANDGLMQSVLEMHTFNDKLSKKLSKKSTLIAALDRALEEEQNANAQTPMSSSSKQALITENSELQNFANEQSFLIERQNERIEMLDTENQELTELLVRLTD
ncbi:hypothetical protein ACT3TI_13670, partial [Psychrobacter sp. AOP22-C1-22]|uniref:hypothetical protein n=1 Tax=Psychrobacter sp. AOP22-C1-22 TaxID=3457719 RepID=UPI004035297F